MRRRLIRKLGKNKRPLEVTTDGRTTWINGPNGSMLGRLSPTGIDVHGDEGASTHCLDCRVPPDKNAWEAFRASMKEHHGVEVPQSFKPDWCV